MSSLSRSAAACAAAAAILLAGCQRETRRFRELAPANEPAQATRMSGLRAGPGPVHVAANNPYDANAYGIAQGQRLYTWMNCAGCHAHGGGAIGPPLMDGEWIYGADPENIFLSIVEGRPNGMPSFRGRMTDQQVWQLVAYVQSLSGHVRKDAAPGRIDGMHVKQRELAKETEPVTREKGRHR